jgi:peptidoglycan hydrolase CwlO-like protein
MDVGTLLLGGGAATVLTTVISALLNRRKLGADTAAVLSKAAADLVETQAESIVKPLRERIRELERQVETLAGRVREATAELDLCHTTLRDRDEEIATLRRSGGRG